MDHDYQPPTGYVPGESARLDFEHLQRKPEIRTFTDERASAYFLSLYNRISRIVGPEDAAKRARRVAHECGWILEINPREEGGIEPAVTATRTPVPGWPPATEANQTDPRTSEQPRSADSGEGRGSATELIE